MPSQEVESKYTQVTRTACLDYRFQDWAISQGVIYQAPKPQIQTLQNDLESVCFSFMQSKLAEAYMPFGYLVTNSILAEKVYGLIDPSTTHATIMTRSRLIKSISNLGIESPLLIDVRKSSKHPHDIGAGTDLRESEMAICYGIYQHGEQGASSRDLLDFLHLTPGLADRHVLFIGLSRLRTRLKEGLLVADSIKPGRKLRFSELQARSASNLPVSA